MATKLKVHNTPKPKSEQEIVSPLLEVLQIARNEVVTGVIVGWIHDGYIECYTVKTPDCDTDDMLDLADMIKYEILDGDTEEDDA